MTNGVSILIAGFHEKDATEIADGLHGASVTAVSTFTQLFDALTGFPVDLLIVSDGLEGMRANETYARLRKAGAQIPARAWWCISPSTSSDITAALALTGTSRIFFLPVETDEVVRQAARILGVRTGSKQKAGTGGNATVLAGVWAKFRDSTLARIDILENAVLSLLEGKLEEEERGRAEREAHKLVGSSGTFGFPRSSRLAREVEQRFGSGTLDPSDAVALSELLIDLRQDLEGSPEEHPSQDLPAKGSVRRLLLLSEDTAYSSRLIMEAAGRGFEMTAAAGVSEARRAIIRERPALALVSLPATGDRDATLDLIHEFESGIPCVPVIALSSQGDFSTRIEVARQGAHGFLELPSPPVKVLDAVVAAFDQMTGVRATILAVDDDAQVLAAIRSLLEPLSIRVVTVNDPLKFWDAIEESSPDLILMDIDMPLISGFELARALRQDARYERMPLLFVTAREDSESIQRAFRAGADDYVRKPIVPAELLMRITGRLDRSRLHKELAETDALTGIANRRKTSELLDRFIRLARRNADSLSLALLDIDHFKKVNDNHGHAAGDEVLRGAAQLLAKSLRPEDVVGRWGGEEFVVGMYGTTSSEGARRIREVLARFSSEEFAGDSGEKFHVTFSGGVGQFPADGDELADLHRVADAALYQAKQSGRNKVIAAGESSSENTRHVDVAIVDDDEALCGLLAHSLETQRFSFMVFGSGDRALEALAGEAPSVFARVILLDVDLPALNGLDVLRSLVAARVTQKSKVIMLSARSGERDILTALELGAADHVTKPFSIQVLMQKLRAALRDSLI